MPAKKLLKESNSVDQVDGRAGADTIRLWEGYREQAHLWRALALLQIPTTFLAIGAALLMFFFADTTIEVPDRPEPGVYSAKQLPDSAFINVATQVINLMATYQPKVASQQFDTALKYLWEPALSAFQKEVISEDLPMILNTSRTQVFMVDSRSVKIERYPDQDKVVVRLPGTRLKIIGNKPQNPDEIVYYVTMTTIPRNIHNEYGIVVKDIRIRRVEKRVLQDEDQAEADQKAAEAAKEAKANK